MLPRGHTEKRIDPAQADVVRDIFRLSAAGNGYARIARLLNDTGAVAPMPRHDRPRAWSPSSVYEILHRPLYAGTVVWNKTRRRGPDGSRTFAQRPASEWHRIERPDLRIVSPELWQAATARLDGIKAQLQQASGGRLGVRRRDCESPYLLSGFARSPNLERSWHLESHDVRLHDGAQGRPRRVQQYAPIAHDRRRCGGAAHADRRGLAPGGGQGDCRGRGRTRALDAR